MSITVSQQFVKVFDSHENDPLLLFLGFCFCFLGFFLLYFFWGGCSSSFALFCLFVLFCFVLVFGGFLGFFVVDKTRLSLSEIVAHIFPNWKIWTFSRKSYLASAFMYLWWHIAIKLCAAAFICFYCVFE